MPTAMTALQPPPEPPLETRFDELGIPFGVRPYEAGDRPALEAFYTVFEPKRAAQGLPPAEPPRIARWLSVVLGHGVHLLAFRDGTLIAHALLVPAETPGVAEYAIFLRQDQRGRGVGTELSRAAIAAARAAGFERLWLTVEPYNRAAVRSYEKAGFRFRPHTPLSQEVEMELEL